MISFTNNISFSSFINCKKKKQMQLIIKEEKRNVCKGNERDGW
jgi:hypothetical protein